MKFTKMHGCGNDYIYIDGAKEEGKQNPALQQNVIIIFLTQIFLISG